MSDRPGQVPSEALERSHMLNFAALGFTSEEAVVVTGSGNGIGRATAVVLARSGPLVVAWDVDESGLSSLVDEITDEGGRAIAVTVDLNDEEAIASAWDRSASVGLPIPYLVNNAGPASTTDLTVMEGLRRSVGSYVAVTDEWLGRWGREAKSVTFTASIAGNYYAGATRDWYPTGKAAVAGYTRHLAVKHRGAPRSNAVAPGGIVTQRTSEAYATPAMKARLERQPMQRPGNPDEIAAVICFLLSPAASFVNGVVLPIDGGATLSM